MEEAYRILAAGHEASGDTRRTGLNNNDVVVGPSGAGKTRGYVEPNILQCAGSMVVTDTKGALYGELGGVLRREGYRVRRLDLADPALSPSGYNPLEYVGYDRLSGRFREQDILTLAACLVPVENQRDPFWELAARVYMESAVAYVLECLPRREQHLGSVARLLGEMGRGGRYGRLIRELAALDPDSLAVGRYRLYSSMAEDAEKTHACIQGILGQKLAALSSGGARSLYTCPDRVDIRGLGRTRTALFLNVSDTDGSMYGLANVFYTQALHVLCGLADRECPDRRLPVPVRFILDDFASNVRIPDFGRLISVIRSRGISVSIIIQSVSQLEGMYGQAGAMTVMDNCDHCLYLGGQDPATARYMGIKANRTASAMLGMGLDDAWLFTRGSRPEQVKKYDLKSHPKYRLLPEYRRECGAEPRREELEKAARASGQGHGDAALP